MSLCNVCHYVRACQDHGIPFLSDSRLLDLRRNAEICSGLLTFRPTTATVISYEENSKLSFLFFFRLARLSQAFFILLCYIT